MLLAHRLPAASLLMVLPATTLLFPSQRYFVRRIGIEG